MATVKLKSTPEMTGNPNIDVLSLQAHQKYLINQLNYILNNLDSDNIIEETKEEY